jgi:hypothetical protein
VGLGNVTNESKATMFASPTFTGTVSGVTAAHVGLGNVTNESKATMFSSPTFTGTTTLSVLNAGGSTGTAGQFLVSNGASAAAWASPGARVLISSGQTLNTNIDCAGYSTLEIFYRPVNIGGTGWITLKDSAATPAALTINYQISRVIGPTFNGGSTVINAISWVANSNSAAGDINVSVANGSQVQSDFGAPAAVHLTITGWGTNTVTVNGTGYVVNPGAGQFGSWHTLAYMTSTSNVARYLALKQDYTGNGLVRVWGYR